MHLPKISIIIPLYNVEKYITECLQSVADQTYKGEMECLIVDDCGTDNSVAVVGQFMADYTGPIAFRLLHHEHNRGLSAARNTGLDAVTGEYVFFIDSDDIIKQETLSTLYGEMEKDENNGIVSILPYKFPEGIEGFVDLTRWEHVNRESKVIEANRFNMALLRQDVFHTAWGKLIKRDLIGEVRFMEGRNNEDTRFWFELSPSVEKKGYKFVELPDKMYGYRVNEGGICANSNKLDLDILRNWIDIRDMARTDEVRLYAWRKAFDFDYKIIREHLKDSTFDWVRKDLKKYNISDVRKMGYSWKKCMHFIVYRSTILSRLLGI